MAAKKNSKQKRVPPSSPTSNSGAFLPLTPMQQKFVDVFNGNASASAAAAGSKQPKTMGSRWMQSPGVIAALERRSAAMDKEVAKQGAAKGEIMGRNDVLIHLSKEARDADVATARVKALDSLAKIYNMHSAPRTGGVDDFEGWNSEEMIEYYRTGLVPEGVKSRFPARFPGTPGAGAEAGGQ